MHFYKGNNADRPTEGEQTTTTAHTHSTHSLDVLGLRPDARNSIITVAGPQFAYGIMKGSVITQLVLNFKSLYSKHVYIKPYHMMYNIHSG